jgi:CheY-like chemotaxis protein
MLSLAKQCILILEDDATNATELVRAIEDAGGDTIYAATTFEALQRLDQFDVNAAVIDYVDGGPDRTKIVAHLRFEGIPFCVHAISVPPAEWAAPVALRIDMVAPLLAKLLAL